MSRPLLALFAGPNGTGKTTLTRLLYPDVPVVNPDSIAAELSPGSPEEAAFAAGRIAIERIARHLQARESFATETTLAGRWIFRALERARRAGYRIELVYVCVESEWLASQRVWERKEAGGHFVSERDVQRRYRASLKNLPHALLAVDQALLYDNSGLSEPRVFAEVRKGVFVALEASLPAWFESAAGENVRVGDPVGGESSGRLGGAGTHGDGADRIDISPVAEP